MDHGLETASERLAASKSAYGTLVVKAGHQGGDFVLQVMDDGRGLNTAKIAEKAGRLGLLPPSGASSPHWLEELVFRPGFSTAGKVSDVSGRGVGLDVVKRRVQSLKGSIHLESWEGIGCRFTIRIPLTLALMEGVLLRAGQSLYLLPLNQVGRFWNVEGELTPVARMVEETEEEKKEREALVRPSIPQLDLAGKFGEAPDPMRQSVGIEVGSEENRVFLMADEILGKKQVVLKGLTGILEGFPAVNGAALLSDGRISLVLDVPALLREQAPVGGEK
jgi:two-component system chemotaxis sensor kinase CheA